MKRLFTRLLTVSFLMVFGLTSAWAQKSVLNESFTGKALPAGWSTSGDFWEFQEGSVKFNAAVENGKDTLCTPLVSLSELDNKPSVKISYSLTVNSGNVNTLKVLYRASADGEWAEWKTFSEATDGAVTVKDVLPDGLANVQIAIAGAYNLGGDTRVYLLALENKTEATDAPTGLKVEDLTTTTAMLWWDVCSSPKFVQYNVKVSTKPLADPDSETGDVVDNVGWMITDEFYELTNLTPNQQYYLYVQYDCGYGDVSPWAELAFRTPCEAISIPYTENFEDGLSTCYTIIKDGSATIAEVSGEYPHNSTKSFKVNIEGTAGFYNYLILPELNGNVKDYQISFWAASQEGGNTYARKVAVGVCTDAADKSTFTEIATLELPKGRTWENVVVSLKGYTGVGKFIALKIGHESKKTNLFIDDIRVEAASACPKPMFVQATEITPNAAKLSWTKTGGETEWNLVVSTKPLADPEDIEPDAAKGEYAGSISTNPYTVANLLPNTTYYAYLQAGCGSSEWTSAVEFKTSRPVTYPYSEHFDRLEPDMYTNDMYAVPNGWVMDCRNAHVGGSYYDQQPSESSYKTFVPYVVTSQNHETTAYVNAAMQLKGQSDGTGSTSANVGIAIMPAMPENVTIKDLMVSFWALSTNGTQTIAVGVAKNQDNSLQKGKQLGENITLVNTATIPANEWTKCKVLMKAYEGEGRYIVFSIVPPSTGTPTIYIDDIEIDEAPDCNAVSTLTAEATGINKATATWTDASSSTSWIIKVSSTEIDPSAADGDIVAAQTVNAKTYNITGLAMGQTYNIYVSPTCGDAWMHTTVTTLVGLQVPYYNDFQTENQGSNAARGPKNWTLGNINVTAALGTQTNIPYVYNTAMTGAPAGVEKPNLYFYHSNSATNTGAYAIMPELLNADVKDLKISFYGSYNSTTVTANYSKGMIRIGVVEKPSDINKTNAFTKVTPIATVYCSAPKITELFTVDCSKYTGNNKYIVFYSDTAKYNYFMLDNLSISLATDPQPVSDVKASEITQTGANLTWKENGKATKWEVKVFAESQDDPEADGAIWSNANITEKSAAITGLSHSTQYYAYVRSVQDNGKGAWGSTSFWTKTGTWAVPFVETFNSYATGGTTNNTLPPYYDVSASLVADKNYPYVRAGSLSNAKAYDGNAFNFQTTSTNTLCQLLLPPLDKPINTLQMSMVASPYSSSASYLNNGSYTQIGVVESDGTFVEVAHLTITVNNVWTEWFVNFGSYAGPGGQIAIRQDYNASGAKVSTYLMMDQIVIEEIPLCGRVTSIDVDNIDSISATISWEKGKTENAWNLKVSTKELADPSAETADAFDAKVTEQTKALTNLEGNTKYYVYVQSVDEVLECEGKWSNATVFRTLCKLQTFPYAESFDPAYYTTTGAGNLPDCSTISGQDPDHSYITTRGTGNLALYLRQVTKDHNNYFAFPALSVDSVKRLQLSMQVAPGYTTATNYYYYEVGVMTDPNDPSTFVSLAYDSVQGAANYPFSDKMYTFEGYKGDGKGNFGTYIALKPLKYATSTNANAGAGYVYIDNVTIDFIETCFKPTDVTGEIGTDTVKLSWNSDNEGASYLVRVFADKDADPKTDAPVAETTVTDKEAVIRGLTGNTMYYAYVQALCSETDKSKWSSVYQFKTECPEVTPLPYAEDFEAYSTNSVPDCWTALDGPSISAPGGGGTIQGKAYVSSTAAVTGSYGLMINSTGGSTSGSGGSYSTASIVTPPLDVENLREALVYFDCKGGSAGASLRIEAVADNTKDADAIVITQVSDISNTWGKVYIKLADYYTSVQPYKYLRFTPATQGKSIYIDNIVFTKDLNTILPVEDLKLQMLSESTIKFSFTEFTPTINQWQVAYIVTGGDIADATIQTIDTKEYTITGLSTNTTYDIYVRGNVDGDQWVGPLTATTIQTPAPLPLISGFEDDVDQWVFYQTQKEDHFYPNFWIVGGADKCAGTGNNALFVTNDSINYIAFDKNDGKNMDPEKYAYQGSNITATSYVWATRNINIESVGTYKFSIKYKVPKCYSSDGLYVKLIPAGATFKAGTATLLNGTTCAGDKNPTASSPMPDNCYVVMGKQNTVADWTWHNISLDIEEPGIYTLCFYWYNPSAGEPYATPAAIDSVVVEEYLCTTPKDFTFAERKARTVTVEWFSGKCKDFEYVVSKYANLGMPNLIDAEDKIAAGTINNGPQVTVNGLLPNTDYSIYVRTICPDGETDWVEFDFNTPCELEQLPYTESFAETPECWILSGAAVGITTVGTGSEDAEKWNRLLLNATSGMAILPELSVPINKVEIEVGLFNTTTNFGAVQLGVMDNAWDVSTFKEIAFFQTVTKPGNTGTYIPTQLEVFSKMLNLYQGSGKVLAIKNATSNNIGIKYVKLTELPDCVKPQQVEITLVSESAATVNWIAGLEEAWEIMINDSIIENVTTQPYRVTGLEQGTVYKVAVRALCDAESKSEWSLPTTFQTPCGVNPLPMFEDFSSLVANEKPAVITCWDNMVTENPIEQVFNGYEKPFNAPANKYYTNSWISYSSSWGATPDQLMFFGFSSKDNTRYLYRWMITPQYAIEGNASLSFDSRCIDNNGTAAHPYGRFIVAISTDDGNTWKKEDATQFPLDSVYTTNSLSLNKYAGKTIRVAFYMEDLGGTTTVGKGSGLFTFVDNVRMNCTETFAETGNACVGSDYEGNGFSIKAEDLPVAGADSTYERFAKNTAEGCDSIIALTITTRTASEDRIEYATICNGEVYEFGGQELTKANPEGTPYKLLGENMYGCDSIVYLYLTVAQSDTLKVEPIEIRADQLPYAVDEFFTVPADAAVGEFEQVVKTDGCQFNLYTITIKDAATGIVNVADDIDHIDVYDMLGRKVQTLHQGDAPYRLQTGVYMLVSVTNDGKAANSRVTVK